MEMNTVGTVLSASKQWWLKFNTKAVRFSPADGALFPYIVKVRYTVDGKNYTRRKWVSALSRAPEAGSRVTVRYRADNPSKCKLIFG